MTCIIGLEQDCTTYIGADSASVTRQLDIRATMVPKVFRNGEFIIGYTTSFRMGQLLQFVKLPSCKKPTEKYMINDFIEAIRSEFKKKGYSEIDNNVETGGSFIVGIKGYLYRIGSDFQVQRYVDGIAAIGCGDEYAYGAMRALKNLKPEERIKESLEIAAYYSAGIIAPFTILKTQ